MKLLPTVIVCLIATAALSYGQEIAQQHPTLAIGKTAPAFSLPGIDGKVHKLSDYQDVRYLAVIFACNTCPICQMYEERIEKFYREYRNKGVALVVINPNNPKATRLEEQAYTDLTDSLDDMKIRAEYRHLDYPYLYDGETQAAATTYGPTVTPQIFVFDQDRKLRYTGRIDDARIALDVLLAGGAVPVESTPAIGCSVAWKDRVSDVAGEAKRFEAEPVDVTPANADDLKALRTNPTGKLMLVNFWATWCGPCVGEFPDLQAAYRMYRRRGFELVTVSENDPAEKAAVLQFLRKNHASSTNRLFATADTSGLQEAFDHNMGAAVPFTVLIAANGDVVYQEEGALSMLALRRAILENLPDSKEYPGLQEYWSIK